MPWFLQLTGLLPADGVFDQILALDNTETTVTSSVNFQPETCAPTGTTTQVQNTILAAVRHLRTDLAIQSVVRLDEYQTPLNFLQADVPTILSDRVLYLVGLLGKISESAQYWFCLYHSTDVEFIFQSCKALSQRLSSPSLLVRSPVSPIKASTSL